MDGCDLYGKAALLNRKDFLAETLIPWLANSSLVNIPVAGLYFSAHTRGVCFIAYFTGKRELQFNTNTEQLSVITTQGY